MSKSLPVQEVIETPYQPEEQKQLDFGPYPSIPDPISTLKFHQPINPYDADKVI